MDRVREHELALLGVRGMAWPDRTAFGLALEGLSRDPPFNIEGVSDLLVAAVLGEER